MIRTAYVNGRYLPHAEAAVHVEDRGYQFSDGVYEVATFYRRVLVDGDLHVARLLRSLDAIHIRPPMTRAAIDHVLRETIRRNPYENGYIYLQVTRGTGRRDHVFKADMRPAMVITVSREKKINPVEIAQGGEVIIRPDIRWLRKDIKSISLLPNVLLKNEAQALGKREVWLTDEKGLVTEASVSNAYIVTKKGVLVTRETGQHLLAGITRQRILRVAGEAGIKVEERPFTAQEIREASETFISASTAHMVPIVKVDDHSIGSGKPGPVFQKIFGLYVDSIEQDTGYRIWQ